MKKSTQVLFCALVGIFFMTVILVLVVMIPCPTPTTFTIFRIVIAIAVAAFAAVVPGFFEFKFRDLVTAGGALGVFALVYIKDPAKDPIKSNSECDKQELSSNTMRVKFVINGTHLKEGVRVETIAEKSGNATLGLYTDQFGAIKFAPPKDNGRQEYRFKIEDPEAFINNVIIDMSKRLEFDTTISITQKSEPTVPTRTKIQKITRSNETALKRPPPQTENRPSTSSVAEPRRAAVAESSHQKFLLFGTEVDLAYVNQDSVLAREIRKELESENLQVVPLKVYSINKNLQYKIIYPKNHLQHAIAIQEKLKGKVNLELREFQNEDEKTLRIILGSL